jgi:hypothetical protein
MLSPDGHSTITSELMPNENDRPEGRSRTSDIAGAGLIREPATVDSQSEAAIAHLIEESCSLKRSVDALLGPEESRCRGEAALADRA